MQKENFWTDEFAIYMMFGLLLASFETISSTLALAIKFLTDHPPVVQKLTVSKLKITENSWKQVVDEDWFCTFPSGAWENPWEKKRYRFWTSRKEHKSMTYTHHVVNESLRLASVAPGMLRRAIKDIQVEGYTIPKGWTIMVVLAAVQLNPNTYKRSPCLWSIKMG